MLGKTFILLCSAAILVSAGGPDAAVDKTAKVDIVIPTTAPKNTTTTSTTEKITTSSSTTPKSTTTPTTPSTTTSTTSKPSTSTPTPVPTTVAPPTPTTRIWVLNGTNDTVCIVAKMAVQFDITYPMNKTTNITQKIVLPVDKVVVSGSCDETEQTIILSWNSTMGIKNDSFSLHFLKNDTTKKYTLHHIELDIVPQDLPKYNATSNDTLKFMHVADEYPTGLGNSYRCQKEKSFKLTNQESNQTSAILKLDDVQFQAFKSDKNTKFGLPEDCSFDTPDIVPIAVGCGLAVLVVIVLVAYLIGRRRAQGRGYVSM